MWKQHVFVHTNSSKKTSQETISHILTKIVLPQCSSHKCAYCFIDKPYLADKSFHNSHRMRNGKYTFRMAAIPEGLLNGQIISFKYRLGNKSLNCRMNAEKVEKLWEYPKARRTCGEVAGI